MHLPRNPLLAAALCLLISGCFVQIDDKSVGGVNPCDPSPCEKKGVCTDWTATCTAKDGKAVCSGWTPSGAAKGAAPEGYEAEETLCDGLDNDCDGLTDETPIADIAKACPTVGVCAGQAAVASCVAGAWQCTFAVAPAWEITETTCDGKDNDCDGLTDEGVLPGLKTCKQVGVCAGLAAPTCAAGSWECHYGDAPDYEATEQSCDGKDNDCDGVADANLTVAALADGKKCAEKGVCTAGVTIACKGGVATCEYGTVKGWEAVEGTCDGKDNDCDGSTDNLQGSKQPLRSSEVADCAKLGVCKLATSSQLSRTCQGGKWACNYSMVPYFEPQETLCDDRDNDCNGTVDLGLKPPAVSPCGSAGVCGGGVPLCKKGLWTCDWAGLAKVGYQAFEQTCDGKDNDCDGSTDEDVTAKASGCKAEGVCKHGAAVQCDKGAATCDYSFVLAFEATETMCDGKDNDCDGVTDESKDLDISKSGCALGVCKDKAKATCDAGAWKCSFAGVTGYESSELSCDGKDNDCDGLTDENLNDPVAAKCKELGVCKGAAAATCSAGIYGCTYTSGDFQNTETLCDRLDNDCDGQTDIGLCTAGANCVENNQCTTGGCAVLLGGPGKVCTPKASQCAQQDATGAISYSNNGVVSCADDSSTQSCSAGTFSAPTACPKSSPACFTGKCQLCIPNRNACDVNNPADVVKCSADAKTQTKVKTCSTGKCAGQGVCVLKNSWTVNDKAKSDGVQPMVATLTSGGFVVVWIDKRFNGNVIVGRVYGADGTAAGAQFDISDSTLNAQSQNQRPTATLPAVTALGTGFAAAWATQGDNVRLRRFDAAGKALAAETKLGSTTSGRQLRPVLATLSNGMVAVWQSEAIDGSGMGIAMQRYDAAGKAAGAQVLVNAKSTAKPDSQDGPQTAPWVTRGAKSGFVVSWVSVANGIGSVWARPFDDKGAQQSPPIALSGGTKNINQARIIIASNGVGYGTWRQNNGANSWDVIASRLGADLQPVGNSSVVHGVVADEQSLPALTVAKDGRLTLIWQSYSKAAGFDLRFRDQLASGAWAAVDALLVTVTKGEQDQGATLSFPDGRLLFVWRSRADDVSAKGVIQAVFR